MSRPTLVALTMLAFYWMALNDVQGQRVGDAASGDAETAKAWLEKYDADRDGKLNRQELEQALSDQFAAGHVARPAATGPSEATTADGKKGEELQFIRVTRDDQGNPQTLETAITRFSADDSRRHVDLIGAVHVGDKTYYEQLNRLFRDYDVVLYELIAPEGTRVPRGGHPSDHPIGRMQRAIKSMLDLSFQLDEIDYTAPRLVHADMSPADFARSMDQRGESFLQILFRMMGQAAAQAGRHDAPSDRDLLLALFAPDRSLRLKRILAAQFEDLEGQMAVFEGPSGSTLISERNKRALDVLRQQQELGHQKIGIFYGAGHLPDMAERLQEDFGFHYDSTRWVPAWNMSENDRAAARR
jgi:hypothetical protein